MSRKDAPVRTSRTPVTRSQASRSPSECEGAALFVPAGWRSRDPLQSASTRREPQTPLATASAGIAGLSQRLSQRAQLTAK
jgi:hypothetical protein